MSGKRHRAREIVLKILFMADSADLSPKDAQQYFFQHFSGHEEAFELTDQLVSYFCDQQAEIDERIRAASEHWRMERMSAVDRNILRLAVSELLATSDIPRRVTLNEAIELAKRYGSEESSRFINGILDRIAEEINKQ